MTLMRKWSVEVVADKGGGRKQLLPFLEACIADLTIILVGSGRQKTARSDGVVFRKDCHVWRDGFWSGWIIWRIHGFCKLLFLCSPFFRYSVSQLWSF